MRTLVDNAEPLTIVGVVQPKEDASATVLSMGIGYPDALIGHLMDLAADSRIVQSQLADPQTDVFTARSFGDEADGDQIDMNALFSVDEEAIENAFTMDEDALDFSGMDFSGMDLSSLDLTDLADPGSLAGAMPSLSQQDVADLLGSLKIQVFVRKHASPVYGSAAELSGLCPDRPRHGLRQTGPVRWQLSEFEVVPDKSSWMIYRLS